MSLTFKSHSTWSVDNTYIYLIFHSNCISFYFNMKLQNELVYILQKNGVVLSNRNKPNKITPLFVEDENLIYQR